MNIVLLAGSPAIPSRSTRLLHHAGDALSLLGHRTIKMHVRELPAQALLNADFADEAVRSALATIAAADALIIATPIYKAAYSGVLKAFLDLLPQGGLAGKPVLSIATGGSQSHFLALDYALRPVLAALSAGHILPAIFATDTQVGWTAERGLVLDDGIARRIQDGVTQLSALLRPAATRVALAPLATLATPEDIAAGTQPRTQPHSQTHTQTQADRPPPMRDIADLPAHCSA